MEIEIKKASDLVSDHIESLIKQGEFHPGERLPSIKEWAEKLEVSVSTVREAAHILKTKGLIEVRQGEGTFVRKIELKEIASMMNIALIQKNDINELMEFRNIFEIGTVQLAAQNRTEEDLQELRIALEDMKTLNQEKKEQADFRFHCSIAKATQNTLLLFIFESISPAIKSLMNRHYVDISDQKWNDHNWNDHYLIFKGIEEQDIQMATHHMNQHLIDAKQRSFPETENKNY